MDFYLSSKYLKQIRNSGIDDDFEIIIFDETIKCSTFSAIFISKQIMKSYLNDRTIRRFSVDFPSKSIYYENINDLMQKLQQTGFISEFKNLIFGEPIHFDTNQSNTNNSNPETITKAQLLIEFGKVIENDEMIEKGLNIIGLNTKSDITISEVIEQLKIQRLLGYYANSDQQYDFIATNFYTIFEDKEKSDKILSKFKELSNEDLERILSSEKLQIASEDSLFDMITSFGNEFFFLLNFVEIQYLSIEKVKAFIEIINSFDIPVSGALWSSICRRLVVDISDVNKDQNPRVKFIPPNYENCENGILRCLEKSPNDNVFLSKIIDVEVSGISSGEIESLFDHSKNSWLRIQPKNSNDFGFIILDFKDKKVGIDKYYFSVPSGQTGQSGTRPRTWVIEGSNDKNSWDVIDKKENDCSLNSYEASNSFVCQNKSNKSYRYIRIQSLMGSNGSSDHKMLLSEIEFYGKIYK